MLTKSNMNVRPVHGRPFWGNLEEYSNVDISCMKVLCLKYSKYMLNYSVYIFNQAHIHVYMCMEFSSADWPSVYIVLG